MELQLHSDFIDYYDHFFDREGKVFARFSKNNISRLEMFKMMEDWGLKVPDYGLSKHLAKRHNVFYNDVVVYLDLYSHRGEDKQLMTLELANEQHKNNLVSIYIPTTNSWQDFESMTYRLLQVGTARFWILYYSRDDWRSNAGDCSIQVLKADKYYGYTKIPYPLFAIDFVPDAKLYAIDFNTAPGLKNTGVKDILDSEEIVINIKKFYQIYSQGKFRGIEVYTKEEQKEMINYM